MHEIVEMCTKNRVHNKSKHKRNFEAMFTSVRCKLNLNKTTTKENISPHGVKTHDRLFSVLSS
jgi:hypothetical protein